MAKRSARQRRSSRRTGGRTATIGIRYLESSAVVAALLEGDREAQASLRVRERRVTSALTLAETARAIIRARAGGRVTPEQERAALRRLRAIEMRWYVVALSDEILARAGRPFPVEPVRTLDAIHLATAEWLAEDPQLITIVTRDERVRSNANALSFIVE